MFLTVQGLPKSIAPYIPQYKEFVKITEEVYLMSKEKIFEAIKKHEVDGSLQGKTKGYMINQSVNVCSSYKLYPSCIRSMFR